MKAPTIVLATGKRKAAIARATVRKGQGLLRYNGVPLELVEPELVRQKVQEPLLMVGDRVRTVNITFFMVHLFELRFVRAFPYPFPP